MIYNPYSELVISGSLTGTTAVCRMSARWSTLGRDQTVEAVADRWVCVVLFEFQEGPMERRVLYEGDEETCAKLALAIEQKSGMRTIEIPADRGRPARSFATVEYGIPYDGGRDPIGFTVAVVRSEDQ